MGPGHRTPRGRPRRHLPPERAGSPLTATTSPIPCPLSRRKLYFAWELIQDRRRRVVREHVDERENSGAMLHPGASSYREQHLLAVHNIAEQLFPFPTPEYPYFRTMVNEPEASQKIFTNYGNELEPDIVVLQWPEKLPVMVAEVVTRGHADGRQRRECLGRRSPPRRRAVLPLRAGRPAPNRPRLSSRSTASRTSPCAPGATSRASRPSTWPPCGKRVTP